MAESWSMGGKSIALVICFVFLATSINSRIGAVWTPFGTVGFSLACIPATGIVAMLSSGSGFWA